MRCAKCEKELHDCQCPWVKTYSGGKPNYTEPCPRCGKVNPAEIHTCTPKESFEYWNAVEGWVTIEEASKDER